jgi:hypothetical protein
LRPPPTTYIFCTAKQSVLYLTLHIRPNIYYAVHYLSSFSNGYSAVHWLAVKQILQYLKGTTDLAICYD